VALNISGA